MFDGHLSEGVSADLIHRVSPQVLGTRVSYIYRTCNEFTTLRIIFCPVTGLLFPTGNDPKHSGYSVLGFLLLLFLYIFSLLFSNLVILLCPLSVFCTFNHALPSTGPLSHWLTPLRWGFTQGLKMPVQCFPFPGLMRCRTHHLSHSLKCHAPSLSSSLREVAVVLPGPFLHYSHIKHACMECVGGGADLLYKDIETRF